MMNQVKKTEATRFSLHCFYLIWQVSKHLPLQSAAIAHWIRLRLPSCRPRFESQSHHLRFYQLQSNLCYICQVKEFGRVWQILKKTFASISFYFCACQSMSRIVRPFSNFFNKDHSRPLFCLHLVFLNNNFIANKCEKFPSRKGTGQGFKLVISLT